MDSGFNDWIYWHFFTVTISYYRSQSILTAEISFRSASHSTTVCKVKIKVRVTLRLAVYRQSVRLGVRPLETHEQRYFFQLISCGNSPYVAPSLT
jgi:hypothetical protein